MRRRPGFTTTTARRLRVGLASAVAAAALALGLAVPATAAPTASYPPLDRPGPALSVPQAKLDAALTCGPGTTNASRPVALFIPGTTLTPQENFSWNYFRAFTAGNRPFCSVELPNHAMTDIQDSAEYVVNAIRKVQARSGQKVAIVGFSQGGMIGRWALRFWPDTRPKVGEVIGIDPSNHGTLDAYVTCAPALGCAPSLFQQATFSKFSAALNSGTETFAGIDYTSTWTPTDEIVFPNLPPAESSRLTTGAGRKANISTFDVCPAHVAEHLSMGSIDPIAYAVVLDALDHSGPASAARINRAVCLQPFHEGVDPVTGPARFATYVAGAAAVLATAPHVPAEPPLRPYAAG